MKIIDIIPDRPLIELPRIWVEWQAIWRLQLENRKHHPPTKFFNGPRSKRNKKKSRHKKYFRESS